MNDFGTFLAKLWAPFEKSAGRITCIVAEYTANSLYIFFDIEKYPTIILDVAETSKNFNMNTFTNFQAFLNQQSQKNTWAT